MSKFATQGTDYSFKVEATPSFQQLPDGSFVKDGFTTNRRADNYAVLGKVTDRYGIVQNTDLVSAAEDAFKSAGLTDYSRRVIVSGQGERFYAVYSFNSHIKALKVGDEIGLQLTLRNSFDGSLNASFLAGLLRLLCLNGMTGASKQFGLTQKHGNKVSVSFVKDALAKAMQAWNESTLIFDRMAQVAITPAQGNTVLDNLQAQRVFSEKMREQIALIWANPTHAEDSARTLYNLYNAVTQYITHEVSGERFELGQRVTNEVSAIFERATRDTFRLAKLIQPVIIDVETVEI